jgi:hypothetical protein
LKFESLVFPEVVQAVFRPGQNTFISAKTYAACWCLCDESKLLLYKKAGGFRMRPVMASASFCSGYLKCWLLSERGKKVLTGFGMEGEKKS